VLTFGGTAGQLVTVRITNNTLGVVVKLLNPNGTTLTSTTSGASAFNLAQKTLGTTGTYSITIDPTPTTVNPGNITISVTSP
jgi:hypothetical protein